MAPWKMAVCASLKNTFLLYLYVHILHKPYKLNENRGFYIFYNLCFFLGGGGGGGGRGRVVKKNEKRFYFVLLFKTQEGKKRRKKSLSLTLLSPPYCTSPHETQ